MPKAFKRTKPNWPPILEEEISGMNPKRLLWQNVSSDSENAVQELQIPVQEKEIHGPNDTLQQIQPEKKPKGCNTKISEVKIMQL